MHISTIFGISISLATGIVLGWGLTNDRSNSKQLESQDNLVAYTPVNILSLQKDENVQNENVKKLNTIEKKISIFERPKKLLNSHRSLEALEALAEISPSIDLQSQDGKEWLNLLVEAYAQTENKEGLLKVYNHFPAEIINNELAALSVSDSLLSLQKIEDYNIIRRAWRDKETQIANWTFLDAEEKVSEGKFKEAANLLQQKTFHGNDEFNRLTKLGALFVSEEPKKAWSYLTEAALLNPDNPDIHTFRASLAEILGRNEIAASEYITAMQVDPTNPQRHEELADFYIRIKDYPKALQILQSSMQDPSNEGIWLKAQFWSKSAMPIAKPKNVSLAGSIKDTQVHEISIKEFIAYLSNLPEGIFWDQSAFNELSNSEYFQNTLQETYWLQLLDDLKNNREEQALVRIAQNPYKEVSWSQEIEKALTTTLKLKKTAQNTPKDISIYAAPSDIDNPKALLELLARLSETPSDELASKIPLDLYDYLLSHDAFVVPFMAEGWTEAAIQLHSLREDPASFPGWITAAFAQALKQNRGSAKAIAFASAQKSSPALSLYLAQIALEADEKEIAFNALKKIYTTNCEEGQNAALLLGQFLMEHNNITDAKRALESQPVLTNNKEAKEILARIAVQENDIDKALKLYEELELYSSEAKSFLAAQAFTEKNWKKAKQLTQALLAEYPDNTVLIDNLKRITAEENKAGKLKKIASKES